MGKKKLIFVLWLLCCILISCRSSKNICQHGAMTVPNETFPIIKDYNLDGEEIVWQKQVPSIVFDDTINIVHAMSSQISTMKFGKLLRVFDKSYFCSMCNYGFGVSRWAISVYEKKQERWKLVANGGINLNACITVEYSPAKNSIIFYKRGAELNVAQYNYKMTGKLTEIGSLSLDELK